jgi:hypothetical protein
VKIGPQKVAPTPIPRRLIWLAALILTFIGGLIVGDRGWHKTLAHRLPDLARRAAPEGAAEELPTLIVDMDFADYDVILDQRMRALQTGVVISSGQDFVPATLRMDDATVPVRMRLLEGPAQNLGADDKWSFEVRTENDVPILGMCRFYLQDPASNNWLNQWAYVQALQREGVLTARYQFVHLIFNGDRRGIYALQEGFAEQLLEAQGRPRGVIVEFDATLLWESISHFQGDVRAAYADPVANLSASDLQYLEVNAFREAVIAGDPDLAAQKDQAIELLRSLQAGQRPPCEVFDVERYGRFLALVDLWGATEGASLVNLKYYYNATSAKLEPIAFNANALGSPARLSLAATYGDPRLQEAYVREATRVSQPGYLDPVEAELEGPWQRLARALGREKEELVPPWEALHRRQEQIRRSLDSAQPVFASLASSSIPSSAAYAMLRISVGNVLNLPVEVLGFDIDGATFLPVERQWVSESSTGLLVDRADGIVLRALDTTRSPVVGYVQFDIPLMAIHSVDREIDFNRQPEVYVATRILGYPTSRLTQVRRGLPAPLSVDVTE